MLTLQKDLCDRDFDDHSRTEEPDRNPKSPHRNYRDVVMSVCPWPCSSVSSGLGLQALTLTGKK